MLYTLQSIFTCTLFCPPISNMWGAIIALMVLIGELQIRLFDRMPHRFKVAKSGFKSIFFHYSCRTLAIKLPLCL